MRAKQTTVYLHRANYNESGEVQRVLGTVPPKSTGGVLIQGGSMPRELNELINALSPDGTVVATSSGPGPFFDPVLRNSGTGNYSTTVYSGENMTLFLNPRRR